MRTADGWTLIPTPRDVSRDAASKTSMLVKPAAWRDSAADRPPIPAPTMTILGSLDRNGIADTEILVSNGYDTPLIAIKYRTLSRLNVEERSVVRHRTVSRSRFILPRLASPLGRARPMQS